MITCSFLADLNLRVVCNELGRAAHKWFKIGIQLGIPYETLKKFEEEEDPFSAVMDHWLKGTSADVAIPVSWHSLMGVMKGDAVNELRLATKIRKKYCRPEVIKVDRGQYSKPPFLYCSEISARFVGGILYCDEHPQNH